MALIYNQSLYLAEQDESALICKSECDRYTSAAISNLRYWWVAGGC